RGAEEAQADDVVGAPEEMVEEVPEPGGDERREHEPRARMLLEPAEIGREEEEVDEHLLEVVGDAVPELGERARLERPVRVVERGREENRPEEQLHALELRDGEGLGRLRLDPLEVRARLRAGDAPAAPERPVEGELVEEGEGVFCPRSRSE